MNTSGEAADQIVKIFMDGAERLVRLSGSGVKHGTVLVYSLAKEQHKTKGKARLSNMLKSGKTLKVYTFKDSDLPQFKKVASQYGILYSILKEKDNTGGVFDVMVRAEDENKIARIIERFKFAQVDVSTLRAEVVKETEQSQEEVKENPTTDAQTSPETEHPTKSEAQRVADDIFSEPQQGDKATKQNPLIARTETTRSEKQMEQSSSSKSPTSVLSERESNTIINGGRKENERDREGERKPSVKKRIEEIKKEREKSAKRIPEKNKGKSRSKNKNKKSRDRSSR